MDLNTIEESIRRLQEKSDRVHFETFQIASDGKSILRTDIEAYEVLLQNLTVAREFEEYRRVNEAVINRFLQLQDRVEHLDRVDVPVNEVIERSTGAVTSEPDSPIREETPAVEPVVVPVVEEPKREETEAVEPTTIDTPVEEKNEEVVQDTPEVSEKAEVSEPIAKNEEVISKETPAEEVKTSEKEPEIPTVVAPVIDNNFEYHLNKDAIIQDLPVMDKSEQTFNTPGMTDEQIKTSQELINSVPVMDMSNYIDPIQAEIDRRKAEYDNRIKAQNAEPTYKAMTDEEVKRAQDNINGNTYKPMSPEEITGSREKLGFEESATPSVDEENKTQENAATVTPKAEEAKTENKEQTVSNSKKKKVVGFKKFNWKDKFTKKITQLKGILFKENMKGRSIDYMKICQMVANFRVNYKNASVLDNNKGLENIDNVISASKGLTFEEKKRLYRKLTRLAKAVERVNRKNQKNAMDNANDILGTLEEETSRGR